MVGDATNISGSDPKIAAPAPAIAPLFEMRLYPHRSLSDENRKWLMLCICGIPILAALRFWAVGAWPVALFLVFDVAAIWLAFHMNSRAGQKNTHIQLTRTTLFITETAPGYPDQLTLMEPYWARAEVKTTNDEKNSLLLKSNGTSLIFGGYLTPSERRSAAENLNHALDLWRAGTLQKGR